MRGETAQYSRIQTTALIIIAFAVVLFLLVQAQFLLVSLATAIVLFSLTSDAINSIARIRVGPFRIPNWLASIAALLLISAALLTLTSIILSQINTVLSTALAYTERAPFAIAALFAWLGEDIEASILNTVRTADISGYLRQLAGQAGNLLQATVLVILFVGFLFAERIWFDTKMTNFFRDEQQAQTGRADYRVDHSPRELLPAGENRCQHRDWVYGIRSLQTVLAGTGCRNGDSDLCAELHPQYRLDPVHHCRRVNRLCAA
jgi:predicted PurR-regulated permease PerM